MKFVSSYFQNEREQNSYFQVLGKLVIYSNVRKIAVELLEVHNEKWLSMCWAEKQMYADTQLLIWAPQRAVASCRLPLWGSWQGNMNICSLTALEKFQLNPYFPAAFTEEERVPQEGDRDGSPLEHVQSFLFHQVSVWRESKMLHRWYIKMATTDITTTSRAPLYKNPLPILTL